ncbi:MAG: hypothetical protein K9N49_01980 [Candidatus Marinimicrobia bacterium]|nr:hypothetical protein [Candidatus Neomarinimicrobiota bacterium]
MRNRMITMMSVGLALCTSRGLLADEAQNQAEAPEPSSFWQARVYALGDSALKEGAASYATSHVALELGHRQWRLGLERQFFAWRSAAAFVEETGGRDPWSFFNRVKVGFSHQYRPSARWMVEMLAGGALGFEEEASDSLTGYLGGYGLCRLNPRLFVLAGVFYSRHQKIETDFDLVPILGVAWNPGEKRGFSAQLGLPETQARWHFTERTRLVLDLNTLGGGVTRLANDSPVRERGYVELSNASLTLRLETRLGDDLDVSLGIGHSVHREMNIYDKDGGNRRSVDIERGPSIEIACRKPF